VSIADHLWEAFDEMALEMGADREGLINQAMHMFARLNGYLTPGAMATVAVPPELRTPLPPPPSDDDPHRREVAQKVLETAAALEQEIHPTPPPVSAFARPPEPAFAYQPPPEPAFTYEPSPEPAFAFTPSPEPAFPPEPAVAYAPPAIPAPEPLAAHELPPEPHFPPASELHAEHAPEPLTISEPDVVEAPPPMPVPVPMEPVPSKGSLLLYVASESGALEKVDKDRFVIGRGKHCDLVIESGKVSREHAAVVREPDGYYIEDLGSSNGTWYDQARIQRRKIADGDEYFICSEKIRCVLR
jgi:hypothetical protein